MTKTKPLFLTILLVLTILPTAAYFYSTASALTANNTPSIYIFYANATGSVTIGAPLIGNITSMVFSFGHVVQSSTGVGDYDQMTVTLSSPLAKGTAQTLITNDADSTDLSFRQTTRNGTSIYTNLNGIVTINNLFTVSPNELKILRNGTRMTVDFNPANSMNITLPTTLFPPANFSATWTLPAFHMDWNGTTTLAPVANPTTKFSSGWMQYQEGAGYSADVTFSCPSWSNYITTAIGGQGELVITRVLPPSPMPNPTNPSHALDYYSGGAATINFPATGNITTMTIEPLQVVGSDHSGATGALSVALTGPLAKGSLNAIISATPPNETFTWSKELLNGTSTYTEVNGIIILNNIFHVGLNELNVQRNGTHVTVDFNPTQPLNIMLDPATFPPANFSSTWTLPAFHMDFDGQSNLLVAAPAISTLPSGWITKSYDVYWTGNSTFTCPTWNNYTISGTSVSVIPFLEQSTQAPTLAVSATPIGSSVLAGTTVTFTTTVSGGVAPYTYQWYQGTNLLTGQTNFQLQLTTSTNTAGSQSFYSQVTDLQGTTTNSNSVTLTVTIPTPTQTPTTQPTNSPTHSPSPSPSLSPSPSSSPTTSLSPSPSSTSNNSTFGLLSANIFIIAVAIIVIAILAAGAMLLLKRRRK